MKRLILISIFALFIGACGQSDEPTTPAADAVYTNAKIYTVDAEKSWASAMAVTDGTRVQSFTIWPVA
jgi:hypothetical protein